MQKPILNNDGLFTSPYTDHDWIILVLAFAIKEVLSGILDKLGYIKK